MSSNPRELPEAEGRVDPNALLEAHAARELTPLTEHELDQLRADVARGNTTIAAYGDSTLDMASARRWMLTVDAQLATLRSRDAEIEALREALRKYGEHRDQCGILRMVCPQKHDASQRCVCGLAAALSSAAAGAGSESKETT